MKDPPAEQGPGVVGIGEPKGHVEIPFGVELRTKGILVVIAIAPGIGEGFKAVGAPVPVAILNARQFTALGDVKGLFLWLPHQTENFIQTRGKEMEAGFGAGPFEPLHEIDVSAAGAYGQTAIGEPFKGTGLNHQACGNGEILQLIIGPLPGFSAPAAADILAEAPGHCGKAQAEAGECGMNLKRGIKMDGARHVRGSSHS